MIQPLYPRGKSTRYPFSRTLVGPRNRSELCGDKSLASAMQPTTRHYANWAIPALKIGLLWLGNQKAWNFATEIISILFIQPLFFYTILHFLTPQNILLFEEIYESLLISYVQPLLSLQWKSQGCTFNVVLIPEVSLWDPGNAYLLNFSFFNFL
jgi:hypothetical protein